MPSDEVLVEDLLQISESLTHRYFQSHDVYSLVLLAYLTVKTFSSTKIKLHTEQKIALIITFLPDLLTDLHSKQILSLDHKLYLQKQISDMANIRHLIKAYIYLSRATSSTSKLQLPKEPRKCSIS